MNERIARAFISDLRREIAELKKERDAWERRCRYLEAKRIERLEPYKFGGEGTA